MKDGWKEMDGNIQRGINRWERRSRRDRGEEKKVKRQRGET
jgi:pre-mRNA-splicing factor 38B